MELEKHFESYRDSIRKTAIVGIEDYAKTRKLKGEFDTAYHYLKDCLQHIKKTVKNNYSDSYKKWLRAHQAALISLHEEFVKQHIQVIDQVATFDLIYEKGWKYFKYLRHKLVVGLVYPDGTKASMQWTPRYSAPITGEPAALDADELSHLFYIKNPALTQRVLEFKAGAGVPLKINPFALSGGGSPSDRLVPVKCYNEGAVNDWTLDLFPEGA